MLSDFRLPCNGAGAPISIFRPAFEWRIAARVKHPARRRGAGRSTTMLIQILQPLPDQLRRLGIGTMFEGQLIVRFRAFFLPKSFVGKGPVEM